MNSLPVLSDKHQEILSIYDNAMQSAEQAAHEKAKRAVAIMVKGNALVGISETSRFGTCGKILCIAAITVAAGCGGKYYLETHGLTFGESVPAEAVNLAAPKDYNPPVNVTADADRLPKPAVPAAVPTAKPCSKTLTGAALVWCQKQKNMVPLHPQKQSENIETIIRGHGRG